MPHTVCRAGPVPWPTKNWPTKDPSKPVTVMDDRDGAVKLQKPSSYHATRRQKDYFDAPE